MTYRAGASIYIDSGRADGLAELQELELVRGDSVAATLKVVYLASRQASCEVVRGVTDVAVGERVRFRPQASATPAPTPMAARPEPRRGSGPGVHGRIGARYLLTRDAETGGGTSQPSLDLRLDGNRLGGSPLGVVADVRARRTAVTRADGSSTVDGRTRVYQAALLMSGRTPGQCPLGTGNTRRLLMMAGGKTMEPMPSRAETISRSTWLRIPAQSSTMIIKPTG